MDGVKMVNAGAWYGLQRFDACCCHCQAQLLHRCCNDHELAAGLTDSVELLLCLSCCDAAAVPLLLLLRRCCAVVAAAVVYLVWVDHPLFETDFFPKVLRAANLQHNISRPKQ
jgi:hypothetical protein